MPPDHRGKRTAAFGDDQVRGHHAAFQTVIGDVVNICVSAMRDTDSFKIERRLLVIIKVAEEFGVLSKRCRRADHQDGDRQKELQAANCSFHRFGSFPVMEIDNITGTVRR